MSRSIWARSSSRRRRRISDCSDEAATAAETPAVPANCDTVPFTVLRQLRSIEGWIPNSIATWVSGRPLNTRSDTASRLNSSVNDRRVIDFVVINPPRPVRSLHEVSTHSGEDHIAVVAIADIAGQQSIHFGLLQSEQVQVDFAFVTNLGDLGRQQSFIPAAVQRQLVVGNPQASLLALRQ